ncbi:MAG: cytochrome c biogenesis protein CcdA [Actinomycetota bacterium]|nr:cytochrome c biogenesis protein CcdA [Actinomycetota bacterium]
MDGNHLILHSPLGFAVAFGAGVISFLSPCVLPLVPSYLSMMSGVGTAELATASRSDQRRLIRATVLFVGGFTLVFAALEATASGLGQTLQSHQRGLDQVAGVVIIAMGLIFAGVLRPAWLLRERRLHVLPSRFGVWAAPVMGMAFAFGWTPCIGPALAAVLGLASDTHTLARGEAMLVAFSLGLGVPFVAAGVAFGRMTTVFAFARRHLRTINLISGLVLSALGVLLLTNQLHVLSTWFGDLLKGLGLGRLASV